MEKYMGKRRQGRRIKRRRRKNLKKYIYIYIYRWAVPRKSAGSRRITRKQARKNPARWFLCFVLFLPRHGAVLCALPDLFFVRTYIVRTQIIIYSPGPLEKGLRDVLLFMTPSSRLAYDEADGWSPLLSIKDPIKSLFESYILIAPFVTARALYHTHSSAHQEMVRQPKKNRDERVVGGGGGKWVTHRSRYSRDDRASWCRPVCVPGHRSYIVCGAHILWEKKTDMKKRKIIYLEIHPIELVAVLANNVCGPRAKAQRCASLQAGLTSSVVIFL